VIISATVGSNASAEADRGPARWPARTGHCRDRPGRRGGCGGGRCARSSGRPAPAGSPRATPRTAGASQERNGGISPHRRPPTVSDRGCSISDGPAQEAQYCAWLGPIKLRTAVHRSGPRESRLVLVAAGRRAEANAQLSRTLAFYCQVGCHRLPTGGRDAARCHRLVL
jgi:hypothetical protein